MKHILIVPFAIGAVLLGGCASTPKHVASLEQARTEVQTLQQDPLVTQAASSELAAARKSLAAADDAFQNGKAMSTIDHYAYLATQQAQTGEARIAEMRAKEQVAKGEADRNRVLLDARTQEADVATAHARSRNSRTRSRAYGSRNAQRELAELQAKQTDRGMVITLSDVLFDTGAATLKPGADLALGRVSEFLQKNPNTKLIVEGHTDSVGSDTYNESLSQRRADAVKAALRVARHSKRSHRDGRTRRRVPGCEQRHAGRPPTEPSGGDHLLRRSRVRSCRVGHTAAVADRPVE